MGGRKFRLTSRKNYERKKYHKRLELHLASETINSTIVNDVTAIQDTPVLELVLRLPLCAYINSLAPSFHVLCNRIKNCNIITRSGWTVNGPSNNVLKKSYTNYNITITILPDNTFFLDVGDSRINNLVSLPAITIQSLALLSKLLEFIDNSSICIGNNDEKFDGACKRRNGKFSDKTGESIVAYYDSRPIPFPTIRHTICPIFITKDGTRCRPCEEYRPNLHSLATREKKRSLSLTSSVSTVNYRYLTSPEKKERFLSIKKESRALRMRIKRLEIKLSQKIEDNGVVLDEQLTDDMCNVMKDHDKQVREEYAEDTFQHVFWRQQNEAIGRQGANKKGVRWHPLIIKWCLYLRHQSSKAYETLRNSGCIVLPSQRTLRDYSHAVKCGAGFSVKVDQQLLAAANLPASPKSKAIVALLIDEMSIKEDLIYDKHTGKVVGFVNLGEVNNHLLQFEQSLYDEQENVPVLAKSMIAFLVKGLFSNLRFPYAQFPCTSITGEQMFTPFWQAVFRLEKMGFKVMATTLDGASVNRRFVAIHDTNDKLVYKLKNIYADDDRHIYCFSDAPHLMKTTRNCWYSNKRKLWNQGKSISWSHLETLYNEDKGKGSGLAVAHKLKYEHLHLTSFF